MFCSVREMPISGMTLGAPILMPMVSKVLLTSFVVSVLAGLLEGGPRMLRMVSLREYQAIAPSKLKKLSSLHYSPIFSQTLRVRQSGIKLLVFDDSTSSEWISLSSCSCYRPSYSKSGSSSATSLTSYYSQFSSIQDQIIQHVSDLNILALIIKTHSQLMQNHFIFEYLLFEYFQLAEGLPLLDSLNCEQKLFLRARADFLLLKIKEKLKISNELSIDFDDKSCILDKKLWKQLSKLKYAIC